MARSQESGVRRRRPIDVPNPLDHLPNQANHLPTRYLVMFVLLANEVGTIALGLLVLDNMMVGDVVHAMCHTQQIAIHT